MYAHLKTIRLFAALLVLAVAALPARAQWAVIDAPAIIQLVQQVRTLETAVQTARDQLAAAKQTLTNMTGDRGMERLLTGTARNYLPSTWQQVTGVMQGDGGFPALSQAVRVALASAAALTPPQLNALPAENRLLIHAARQDAALQMAVAQQALANSSGRFTALQSLIGAIAAAPDQKAILDLQARIGAELGMLQNEQTKLQILLGAGAAQAAIDRQHEFEQAVAAQGLFASRFQPVP